MDPCGCVWASPAGPGAEEVVRSSLDKSTPQPWQNSEVSYRSGRNHLILEGKSSTSVHSGTSFLSIWLSRLLSLSPGELLLVSTEPCV